MLPVEIKCLSLPEFFTGCSSNSGNSIGLLIWNLWCSSAAVFFLVLATPSSYQFAGWESFYHHHFRDAVS